MSVHRNRRSTLVLLLIISLCIGGFAVCYSAEDEPFPEVSSSADAPVTDRPSPFYDEESAPPEAEARAVRTPHLPSKISDKIPGVKLFSNTPKSHRPKIDDAPEAIASPAAREKTPLPKASGTEPAASNETDVPPPARSRTSYGSSVVWAMGILAAGVIIRQLLKAGGSLSNTAPTVVEVLSRQSLGPQQQLSVVRFGQRILLVGTTSNSVTTLAQVEDPSEVQALLSELESSVGKRGVSNPFRFRTAKRQASQSRTERSRWAEADRHSPAVSVSLSTESRAAMPERRPASPPNPEVSDV